MPVCYNLHALKLENSSFSLILAYYTSLQYITYAHEHAAGFKRRNVMNCMCILLPIFIGIRYNDRMMVETVVP